MPVCFFFLFVCFFLCVCVFFFCVFFFVFSLFFSCLSNISSYFFHFVNLVIFFTKTLLYCIGCGYFVKSTPF